MLGYSLLGACWLVLKTEGELQDWARRQARWLLLGVLVVVGAVSLWSPFSTSASSRAGSRGRTCCCSRRCRWSPPPSPMAVVGARARARADAVRDGDGAVRDGLSRLAISLWPMIVPHSVDLWSAAASPKSQAFLMIGTLVPDPGHPRLHRLVLLVFRARCAATWGTGCIEEALRDHADH
jgi:cytochrome d ubiquinol oxidase subunit II